MVLNAINLLGILLFLLAQMAGLMLTPLGFPGPAIQALACLGLAYFSRGALLGWNWAVAFFVLALLAELGDFLTGQWGARKFGGSRKAAWGALLGGILGALFGIPFPLPLAGSVIGSFVGTFLGALLVELAGRRSHAEAFNTGMGALIGRVLGVCLKVAIGFSIALVSVISLVWHLTR